MTPTYVLFLLEDHAYHHDDRPAMAADLPLSSPQVNVLHSRMLDTRILLSVFGHRYPQPRLWWGNPGQNDQAGPESTLDTSVEM